MGFHDDISQITKNIIRLLKPKLSIHLKKVTHIREAEIIVSLCLKNHNLCFIYEVRDIIFVNYKDENVWIHNDQNFNEKSWARMIRQLFIRLDNIQYTGQYQQCGICYEETSHRLCCPTCSQGCCEQCYEKTKVSSQMSCEVCCKSFWKCPFCRGMIHYCKC